ncbi:OB-fold nucleic acid binding domain-containing protein [Brooklawnia cerclae]|uniref:RecG-like helicase n=1 Tax=Brooklawnia cerclae TaxID=349934 RepID=A0ABX0SEY5_9ACTN|nr:OB-fold nucleic acid binding domain-containing protein [Brooklawnia cerclae]NIH56942.1 RecG-like helicase [Brooklawnia cerclae]
MPRTRPRPAADTLPGGLRRLRRLLASSEELANEELAREAIDSGATTIASLRPRTRGVVQGTVGVLTINPRNGRSWLEAELRDGTGVLLLIWMGRRLIPGVDPGTKLRVSGMIADYNGRLAVFNPAYELLA